MAEQRIPKFLKVALANRSDDHAYTVATAFLESAPRRARLPRVAKFKVGDRIRAIGTTAPVGTVRRVEVRATPSGVPNVPDALPDEFVHIQWDGANVISPPTHAALYEHAT